MQWKADAPFVDINIEELGELGKLIYESFKKYVEALERVVKVQLPEILTRAEAIVREVEDVQNSAKDEFGSLNPLDKAKAAKALMVNVRVTGQIPTLVSSALESLKADLI